MRDALHELAFRWLKASEGALRLSEYETEEGNRIAAARLDECATVQRTQAIELLAVLNEFSGGE
jgi:hypothetical protein